MPWNSHHRRSRVLATAGVLSVVLGFGLSNPVNGQTTEGAKRPAVAKLSGLRDPAIEKRVEALLKQMTLEEKVGQLAQ